MSTSSLVVIGQKENDK